MKILLLTLIIFKLCALLIGKDNKSPSDLINHLTNVKGRGVGNQSATKAWNTIKKLPPSYIPKLLEAMNEANPLADNWIRAAIQKISEDANTSLPEGDILRFLRNHSNSEDAREEAFQIIESINLQKALELIPGFLDDPATSIRRKAIAKLLDDAKNTNNPDQQIKLYTKVMEKGREVDQIKIAASELEKAGRETNLQELMGFLVEWNTIGPFDNTKRNGFSIEYPPEKQIDLPAEYKGKSEKVSWTPMSTNDPFGLLDLNSKYGQVKEALVYAHTNFYSASENSVQFRIGSKNAWKLWLNGKLLFARDEYHRGKTRVDQFIIEGSLKKGSNSILVKVCQNEQTQSWTKQWEFCLRITDKSGKAIYSYEKPSVILPKDNK